jgi:hypothetical protein
LTIFGSVAEYAYVFVIEGLFMTVASSRSSVRGIRIVREMGLGSGVRDEGDDGSVAEGGAGNRLGVGTKTVADMYFATKSDGVWWIDRCCEERLRCWRRVKETERFSVGFVRVRVKVSVSNGVNVVRGRVMVYKWDLEVHV